MTDPILYVEDEEDYQILVRRILNRDGLAVDTVDNGAEGYAWLDRQRPSLLILDINLPDTDGYSMCSRLRKDPRWLDLPILMLTVKRRPEEWLEGFSCGADDYVAKPLNPPDLIERVRTCLEGKSRRALGSGAPEHQLIQAALAGNRAAYEVLIEKYRARLIEGMRALTNNAAEAEDVVSYAFLKAYEKLESFRGEAGFYTWLYRIALNEFHYLRRRSPNISLDELTFGDDTVLPPVLTQADPVALELSDRARANQIQYAMNAVPEPYREMLVLQHLQDLSYEDIAAKLDIPLGTVMSRLFKARKLLLDAWNSANK